VPTQGLKGKEIGAANRRHTRREKNSVNGMSNMEWNEDSILALLYTHKNPKSK
jgi:hypothetical protein